MKPLRFSHLLASRWPTPFLVHDVAFQRKRSVTAWFLTFRFNGTPFEPDQATSRCKRMNTTPEPSVSDLLASGLAPIDRAWGGLHRGGAYLIYGSAQSGRHLAMLSIAQAGFEAGERALLVTTRDPAALSAEASTLGLDLSDAYNRGLVRLMRLPAEALAGRDDAGLRKVFDDLVALAIEHGPDRLIVDDFTPLVPFRTFDAFQDAFQSLVADLRGIGSATILGMGEPANEQSKRIVEAMRSRVRGSIHVARDDARSSRQLRLEQAGHLVEGNWDPALTGGSRMIASAVERDNSSSGDGVPQNEEADLGHPSAATVTYGESAGDPGVNAATDYLTDDSDADGIQYLPEEEANNDKDPFEYDSAPSAEQPAILRSNQFSADADYEPVEAAYEPAEEPQTPSLYAALASAFEDHRDSSTPFLVLAFKAMSPDARSAMDGISAEVRKSAGPTAVTQQDDASHTLVTLLPGAEPTAGQAIVSALRSEVKSRFGERTGEVLRSIGTLVIPNGQPFSGADDLLEHVLKS
ncbi:hypothetical protein BH23BAC4_BH23BAC4_04200 [soil metagenome]